MRRLDDVRAIFAQTVDVELDAVHADTVIRDAEDMDSLDMAEFIMECEERFGIEIPDFVVVELKTIGDVAKFVERAPAAAGG